MVVLTFAKEETRMTSTRFANHSLEDADRQTVFHPFTALKQFSEGSLGPARIMESGSGCMIRDRTGREFIDAFAGLYCVNIGYGRREVADAIYEQAKKLAFYQTYAGHSTEALVRLSDRLVSMAPGRPARVFYGLSGSDANETQLKLVWYYNNALGRPHKKKIIARDRGYHGASILSGSMTGMSFYHAGFDLPVSGVRHTRVPDYWRAAQRSESEEDFSDRCARELEDLIQAEGPDTIAAFIAEPVLGTGGIVPPPRGYFRAIQPVLRRHDILLIADEVITGFGRTGAMFGSETYGIEPDLVTLAKGLTSAYAPLSACVVGERVWEVLMDASERLGPFPHGYTYSGHPLGAAAANAVLDIVEAEDLPGNARRVGETFNRLLQRAFEDDPLVGNVRGVGLMAAIEFVRRRKPREFFDPGLKVGGKVAAACLREGLIARAMPHGDILGFSPPLVLREEEAAEIVARTKRAVGAVAAELRRDGAV
jgi:L-2,4-diaminobutyrate transaminase